MSTRALFVWVLIAGSTTTATAELPRHPVLTLEVAQQMVDACVKLSQEQGWRMHVAIKDSGDNLVIYARMDGSSLGSGEIAMQKASVSAKAPWSTAQLGQMAFNPQTGAPTGMAFVAGNILFAGGLPILTADGVHLGGIGVSGGLPQQDEQCAQAGIDAVKADLL
jgi:uncharacterized protein GlcG (DUF336 family)